MENKEMLLSVRDLTVEYTSEDEVVHAVNHVSFDLARGSTIGLVGETGAGKTSIARAILRILPEPPARVPSGEIVFEGRNLLTLREEEMQKIRGKEISMIFQEPMTALDPMYTIEEQIEETLRFHSGMNRAQMHDAALEMLNRVKIPRAEGILKDYPHHLSGGMLQRVMIAIALINNPRLLIADEPTTALDVTIQAQILDLMNELRESYDTSVIMITHDLGVIAETCEQVAVFYAGQVVEQADVNTLFHAPAHPYTKGLLRSVTSLGGAQKALYTIHGTVPTAGHFSSGCRFADRCDSCMEICRKSMPPLCEIESGHLCRCFLHDGAKGEVQP